jgi:four helix bundle protein
MNIERFEELEIWQNARTLNKLIYQVSTQGSFSKDFGLKDQIRRSSESIMDNIAEGFGRGGNKEFINFLSIARGSIDELRSQSYRSFDVGHIDQQTLDDILSQTEMISRKIVTLINYLRKSSFTGPKFKKS